jgi:hypothetical protein
MIFERIGLVREKQRAAELSSRSIEQAMRKRGG